MSLPAAFVAFLMQEVGPRLWDLLTADRPPQFIRLAQLVAQSRINDMRMLAAKERARQRLDEPSTGEEGEES